MAIEYLGLSEINGPLVVLEGVKNASYKYDVPNNQPERFEQYRKDIDEFYDNVLKRNG